jgi:hypothetical protein
VASGSITGVGRFSAGVVQYGQPAYADSYSRGATVRAVGWLDTNNNGAIDSNEPVKIIESKVVFELARSEVFDYTYFVNNFGWMTGFNENQLIINGDMRANGNFSFASGLPTVNGSIVAAANERIDGNPAGLVNVAPVKDTNATYASEQSAANNGDNQNRWRQAYDVTKHGVRGGDTYKQWKDIIFDSDATVQWFRVLVRDDYYSGNRIKCPSPSIANILESIHPGATNIDRLRVLLAKLPMTNNQLYIELVKQIS